MTAAPLDTTTPSPRALWVRAALIDVPDTDPTPLFDEVARALGKPVLVWSRCRHHGTYECVGCTRDVCPDCEPSPGEPYQFCSDCYNAEDPEASA